MSHAYMALVFQQSNALIMLTANTLAHNVQLLMA